MFVIRIEVHNVTNYEPLHAAMSRRGMTRSIPCNGARYDLPTGTYYTDAASTDAAVATAAEAAALEVGHRDPMIVVANASSIRISNLPLTPAWRMGA